VPKQKRTLDIHLPAGLWPLTWPMGLTMLRLLLLPIFIWSMLVTAHRQPQSVRWGALIIFAIMALTDKLDGYLARRLNQSSKLGTILDPIADKILIACSVILLSLDWIAPPNYAIPWPVVLAVYGKDVIVAAGTMVLLMIVGKVSVTPRILGKLSTVFQLAMVIATLLAPAFRPNVARYLTRYLWYSVALVSILSCADYLLEGWRQFRARRLPT
jgi:CDP-diacylglycerol--glycerol-3-phosphate 3-phosphatidyltransferase